MAFSKETIVEIYTKRARSYDLSANLYYLLGVREFAYRKKAIEALDLKRGDTVVEIGCGTGLNFSMLENKVGAAGRIVGVDITPAMLEAAKQRVKRNGWPNVKIVRGDAAKFVFPEGIGGVLSTFALTLVPQYETVIEQSAKSLASGRRMVILDFKRPERWPGWLVSLYLRIMRPFAVTPDLADRRPWRSMERQMNIVRFEELYFGAVYICAAEARAYPMRSSQS